VSVLLPYARGDLLARAHREGEILSVEHTDAGTALTVRVQPGLACELDRFVVASGSA
jgi:GTP-binding protein HflX